MTKGRVAIATAFAAIAVLIASQTAFAQYPPPKGHLVCEYTGSKIVITLSDGGGKAVVGQWAFFEVIAGGASLSTTAVLTDGSGQGFASVSGGSGRLVVRATADGLECSIIADVLGAVVFTPPSTGDAGLAASTGHGSEVYAIAALPLLALAAAVALRRRATTAARIDS